MARFKPGDRLEVVDTSGLAGPRKLPWAKGAIVVCGAVGPAGVQVRGRNGWWKAHRFAAAPKDAA